MSDAAWPPGWKFMPSGYVGWGCGVAGSPPYITFPGANFRDHFDFTLGGVVMFMHVLPAEPELYADLQHPLTGQPLSEHPYHELNPRGPTYAELFPDGIEAAGLRVGDVLFWIPFSTPANALQIMRRYVIKEGDGFTPEQVAKAAVRAYYYVARQLDVGMRSVGAS